MMRSGAQLPGLDLRKHCAFAAHSRSSHGKMINTEPRRRRQPSRGVENTCLRGALMEHVTPACTKPSKKYPQGRTGTSAGYQAHRKAPETPCGPCTSAHTAKGEARKRALSPEALERQRAMVTAGARRRKDANPDTAPACLAPTPEYPDGRRGSMAGYEAHIAVAAFPCEPCRKAAAAHEYEAVCARPTRRYPKGRTGTRSGYQAHQYANEPACPACLEGGAAEEKKARAADPNRALRGNLWNKYRLTLGAYQAMLAAQGGKCAICGTTSPGDVRANRFHVDHDHACCPGFGSCGKCVRGLLCRGCNTALGNFGDDPERLIAAASYLMSRRTEVANAEA